MSLTAPFSLFAQFLGGYLVILATPGPNLLAVAGIASLRGFRAALPLCFGLACGAGALCAAVTVTARTDLVEGPFTRLIGALLLAWVAIGVVRAPGAVARAASPGRVSSMAGLAIALTNPLTAAYFLSMSLAAGGNPVYRAAAPVVVATTALGFFCTIAVLLARPAARAFALRRDREIRFAAAGVIGAIAAKMAWPLIALIVG